MAKTILTYKAKEISEKTFELNITNELLNISKSFIWYLNNSPLSNLVPKSIWLNFFNQSTLFSEGLTQEQESKAGGGYDVSINYKHPSGRTGRLLFLQFKSGKRSYYCQNSSSQFNSSVSGKKNNQHVRFTFNDAANKTQHSILRDLANKNSIQKESVMYVFPRVTEKNVFHSEIGNLINQSSFVPVLDIDNQALNHKPPITIKDGTVHKYRTSYDGLTSEVNFFFFLYSYNNKHLYEIASELICIQIERILVIIKENNEILNEEIIYEMKSALQESFNLYFKSFDKNGMFKEIVFNEVDIYLNRVLMKIVENEIPKAPSRFSTIIPKAGLKLELNQNIDYSSINYQVF